MLFKEAVSKRIFELCDKYGYSPNKLAEMSAVPPSTLRATLAAKVENPSASVIYKICRTLNIEVKEFFDDKLFDSSNLE